MQKLNQIAPMSTVKIEGITKYYGQQKALDNISLSINKGEVVGLLGPNGAGKSPLMKILTSVIPPSSGTARVNGLDVQEQSLEIRKHIGYLPETNPLYTDMYVREYLTFVFNSYPVKGNVKKAVDDVISLTGLGQESRKKIGELSKGYRQRVGLAQALIHDPEILILDEPTSGLDPISTGVIGKLIQDLNKALNITSIVVSHDIDSCFKIADNIILLYYGEIIAKGTVEEIKRAFARTADAAELDEVFWDNVQLVASSDDLAGYRVMAAALAQRAGVAAVICFG